MKIQDVNGLVRSVDPRTTKKPDQQPVPPSPGNVRNSDGDSLDIQLSSRLSEISMKTGGEPQVPELVLSPERRLQIEERVRSGFYDKSVVSEDTAEKLLDFYAR